MVQHTTIKGERSTKPKSKPLQIWNVPSEVKEKFKIRCIQKGTNMRRALLDFMRHY